MIKELWHWVWMFLKGLFNPFEWKNLPYHWQNLWMYLWYGFTLYDLGDMDSYLIKRMADMLPLFKEYSVGYPPNMEEQAWKEKLDELTESSNFLLSVEFYDMHPRKQEDYRRHYLMEIRRYFFWLWF